MRLITTLLVMMLSLAQGLGLSRIGSWQERDPYMDGLSLGDIKKIDSPKSGLDDVILCDSGDVPMSNVRKIVLKNGLTVLLKEDHTNPVVAVQVWHDIGSHDENKSVNGVSHLLEHLLFKGTTTRPVQFMRLFYVLGADANAFTNYDVTVFHEVAVKENLYHLLTLEADRLTNAVIDADHVLSERDVVVSELAGYEGRIPYRLNRALMNYTFGESGYGLPVGGYIQDVENFTADEVNSLYQKYYGPSNAALVITGDFDMKTTTGWVQTLFDKQRVEANDRETIMSHMAFWYITSMGALYPVHAKTPLLFYNNVESIWMSMSQPVEVADTKVPESGYEPLDSLKRKTGLSHIISYEESSGLKSNVADGSKKNWKSGVLSRSLSSDRGSTHHSSSDLTLLELETKLLLNRRSVMINGVELDAVANRPGHAMEMHETVGQYNYPLPPQQHIPVNPAWFPAPSSAWNPYLAPTSFQKSFQLSSKEPIVLKESGSSSLILLEVIFPMPQMKYGSTEASKLHIFDELIAGGHVGLLNRALHEHQVEWDQVGTDFSTNADMGWYTMTVSLASERSIPKCQKAMRSLLEGMQQALVSEDDLSRARVNILSSLLDNKDPVGNDAMEIGEDFVLAKDLSFSAKYLSSVKTVSAQDIRDFVSKRFESGSGRIGILQVEESDKKASNNLASKNAIAAQFPVSVLLPDQSWKSEQHRMAKLGRNLADLFAFTEFQSPRRNSRLDEMSQLQVKEGPSASLGYLDPKKTLQYLPKLSPLSKQSTKVDTGTKVKLKNGLDVRLIPTKSQLVHLTGRVLVGSVRDPTQKSGLASLTTLMMPQGSNNYTYADLVLNLEDDGSRLFISPGRETIAISGRCLSIHVRRMLLVLSEELTNPSFEPKWFEAVKQSLIQSADAGSQSLDERGRQLLQAMIFNEQHPLHSFPSPKSLDLITRDDVVKFYQTHVGPLTTKLTLTGNFEVQEMTQTLEDIFGSWKSSAVPSSYIYPDAPAQHGRSVAEKVPGATNVISLVGRNGISRCAQNYAVALVANEILGGDTLSARLGTHVRDEKGLTYGIYSSYESGIGSGMFVIRMQTAVDKTSAALEAMYDVLNDFVDHGVSDLEVDIAKRSLLSQHTLSLSTADRVGSFLLARELCGVSSPENEIQLMHERLQSVTVEQVNEHIKQHMRPDKFHQVLVGAVDSSQY